MNREDLDACTSRPDCPAREHVHACPALSRAVELCDATPECPSATHMLCCPSILDDGSAVVPEDRRRRSVLFNDITHAPVLNHILLSDRLRIEEHLWAMGWRRDVRPEDVTEGNPGGRP